MSGSFVIDASVAAKLHFLEEGSGRAAAFVEDADRLIAPDLLHIEVASIAAKKVRRAIASPDRARLAVSATTQLLDATASLSDLAMRAFELAAAHGFSAYDGAYLALAEMEDIQVVTADRKLARRAAESRLSHLVHLLED
ncbi:MAG TPA: type II toxin-antitoxin system VapC family toxin [Caulobacteraceae bacterium]|nr:type II toxin-antitoxin system VapC family toxin [Caulobacteraceae bacterium]